MRFHEETHGVYFDDLDAFGILHNARYLLIIERTIGGFWQAVGLGTLLEAQASEDQYHLVRSNHLEYLRAVEGLGRVRCRVWVEKLGRTSLVFGFAVLPVDQDTPYATGTRAVVRVDREHRRPTPWTEGTRSRVAPYVGA